MPPASEDPAVAIALDERLEALWRAHPNFHRIPACRRFDEKLAAVIALVERFSPGTSNSDAVEGGNDNQLL
jgi:hypothetical protein